MGEGFKFNPFENKVFCLNDKSKTKSNKNFLLYGPHLLINIFGLKCNLDVNSGKIEIKKVENLEFEPFYERSQRIDYSVQTGKNGKQTGKNEGIKYAAVYFVFCRAAEAAILAKSMSAVAPATTVAPATLELAENLLESFNNPNVGGQVMSREAQNVVDNFKPKLEEFLENYKEATNQGGQHRFQSNQTSHNIKANNIKANIQHRDNQQIPYEPGSLHIHIPCDGSLEEDVIELKFHFFDKKNLNVSNELNFLFIESYSCDLRLASLKSQQLVITFFPLILPNVIQESR
ncbi:MAG: hypothetical protein HC889_11560 [Synechococcaceae cyanobacterium SM1_2_3]|nr:hypothetical protein [Synechococcaceae cyanobacterium SM1_2_3]